MKLLHLSSRAHRNSILSSGILCSKVKNESHLDEFRSLGLVGDKVVYTWSPDYGQSTSKYIVDMIYCKQFIHPRNDLFDRRYAKTKRLWLDGKVSDWDDDANWVDFSKLDRKILGGDQAYDLYEIEVNEEDYFADYVHHQHSDQFKFSTTFGMDDRYAHDDKRIFLFDRDITPREIKLVSEVSSQIFNNKIHFKERLV